MYYKVKYNLSDKSFQNFLQEYQPGYDSSAEYVTLRYNRLKHSCCLIGSDEQVTLLTDPDTTDYKLTTKDFRLFINAGKLSLVVEQNWSAVSAAVGFAGGFVWMLGGATITAQAPMMCTIFMMSLVSYAILEMLMFRYQHKRWPNLEEMQQIGALTRDFGLKMLLSVAGWMTGDFCGTNLSNSQKTMLIALCDALGIGMANLANELPKCENRAAFKTLCQDTCRLMLTAAGAAVIWQKIDETGSVLNHAFKSILNGLAITAEFYCAYPLLGKLGGCLQTFYRRLSTALCRAPLEQAPVNNPNQRP